MDFALLMVIVTVMIFTTESKSGDPVYVQTGGYVQLDTHKELPQFNKFIWLNERANYIVRCTGMELKIYPSYKDRVDFNPASFSLTLKNMQKEDSGIYKARATGVQDTYVAEHNVFVLDPVKTPFLNSTSMTSCAINVTCIGGDLTLSASYHSNCSEEEMTSSEIYNLALYCKEDVVVCNYSNPVSWKNDTIIINPLCTTGIVKDHSEEHCSFFSLHLQTVILASASVLLLAGGVMYCSHRKCKKGPQQTDNTIYAEVVENKVQTDLETTERSPDSHTIYSSGYFVHGRQERTSTGECHIYNEVQERVSSKKQRRNNKDKTTYYTVGQHKKPSVALENDHFISVAS